MTFVRAFGPASIFSAGLLVAGALAHDLRQFDPYDLPKDALFGTLAPAALLVALALRWLRGLPLRAGMTAFAAVAAAGLALPASLASAVPESLSSAWLRGFGLLAMAGLGGLAARERHAARWMVAALAAAGTLTALVGCLQASGWEARLQGMPLMGLPSTDRPGSLFGHVNVAAEVVVLGFAVSVFGLAGRQAATTPARGAARLLPLALRCAVVGLTAAFLALSGTRAAWLAAGVVCVLALPWGRLRRSPRPALCALVGALALLTLVDRVVLVPGRGAGPSVRPSERVFEALRVGGGTQRERFVLWQNTLPMIAERPWTGHGPAAWAAAYPRFARATAIHDPGTYGLGRQPERTHQDLLQLAAELGLPAAAALLALVGIALLSLWRQGGTARGLAAAGIAVLFVGLFAFPLRQAVPAHALAWIVGMGLAQVRRPFGRGVRVPPGLLLVLLAALPLAATAWSARLEAGALHARGRILERLLPATPQTHRELAVLFARIRSLDPTGFRPALEFAQALARSSQLEAAERAYSRVLELRPTLVNAELGRSEVLAARGELDRAAEGLRRSFAVMPDDPDLLYAGARFLVRAAETLGPERAELARWLRSDAERHLAQACAARAYHPEARLLAADLLLARGALAEAGAHLEAASLNASEEPERFLRALLARERPALAAFDSQRFGRSALPVQAAWHHLAGRGGGPALRAIAELALAAGRSGALREDAEVRRAALQAIDAALAAGYGDARLAIDRIALLEADGAVALAAAAAEALLRGPRTDPLLGASAWLELETTALRLQSKIHRRQ